MMTELTKMPAGSFKQFLSAVHEGYTASMHNPCVRWSLERGFFAESALIPESDDEYTIERCNYDANTGGAWLHSTRAEYRAKRVEVLAFHHALCAGCSRDEALEAADYARHEYELDNMQI